MKLSVFVFFSCFLLEPGSSFVPSAGAKARGCALKSAVAPPPVTEETKGAAGEKLTPEAIELLEAFEAKKQGKGHSLIVAQTAPAVRIAISEEFGLPPNGFSPQQLVAALKALGFDLVLDTNVAADLTIMEEGTELLQRIKANVAAKEKGESLDGIPPLPMFTSCCPGWMTFVAKSEPDLAPYMSSCMSPHMMYGSFMKKYSEQLVGLPAKEVYLTSVMPCIKKRGESDQAAFEHDGVRAVDNVITTRDLGSLLRMKGINPAELEPLPYDSPFQKEDGAGSGAGQLFGATGGVMEAAVRTVYEVVTGKPLPRIELDAVRGLEGVKEAILPLYDDEGNGLPLDLKVAVCSGLGNAKKLVKQLKDGKADYHFIEVMACPGGCINGGGQPRSTGDRVEERLQCIYDLDSKLPIRRSHEDPIVQKMYEGYLGEYGSHTAHDLLHVEPVYGMKPLPKKSDDDVAP